MPSVDRGMIKWAPFDSVISGKQVVKEVLRQKNKIAMPQLSEEQKLLIEKNLILAFYENCQVRLDYFYNGDIRTIEGYIKKIDPIYHKIYFNDCILLFEQIVKLYYLIKK